MSEYVMLSRLVKFHLPEAPGGCVKDCVFPEAAPLGLSDLNGSIHIEQQSTC